jgi:hypothetical protein
MEIENERPFFVAPRRRSRAASIGEFLSPFNLRDVLLQILCRPRGTLYILAFARTGILSRENVSHFSTSRG